MNKNQGEQKTEKETSLKVSLKEILWPSFSVSTRTPSQSKRRAEGRVLVGDDVAEQVIPPERDALCTIGFALRHLPLNRNLAGEGTALGMKDGDNLDWVEEEEEDGDSETKEREIFTVAIVLILSLYL